jgi:hypothetical protein
LTGGSVLFLATIYLVIKDGPDAGAHLWLLSHYFPGYGVTVAGSFVGFGYGFLVGFVAGWLTAWIYNRVVLLRAG